MVGWSSTVAMYSANVGTGGGPNGRVEKLEDGSFGQLDVKYVMRPSVRSEVRM